MGNIISHILEIAIVSLVSPNVLLCVDVALFGYLLFSRLIFLIVLYAIWCFVSRNYNCQGGRRIRGLRDLSIWKYYANYFPIKLIKTAELDPNKNYLCGFHPHGYFAGLTINFATEATATFKIPFHRDLVLALGGRNASRESIKWLLTKEGVGNFVVLVPGGTHEMCYTEQRKFKLKLKSRLGFIRIAIETGASLVPIISFGENDIFHVPDENTWIGRKIAQFKERTKSAPPIFYGPIKILPTIPFRVPINTVGKCKLTKAKANFWTRLIVQELIALSPGSLYVDAVFAIILIGKPIDVKQNVEPTDEEICSLHSVYVEQLRQLYKEYNDQFGNANVQLEIY